MEEKESIYKTMNGTGILTISVGIVTIVVGVAAGVLSIIAGAKLMMKKDNLLF